MNRQVIVATYLTTDGIMQSPGSPDEDREGGFEHGGWSMPFWDDTMGALVGEWTDQADALLLGRKTYDVFAAHWPKAGDDPMALKLNAMRKYVASTTLQKPAWNNSVVLAGSVPDAVRALKSEPGGPIHVFGSWHLVQTLMRHDLVDEYRLWTFPIVLGSGKRLFGNGTIPSQLKLLETHTSTTGVTIHRLARIGRLEYGSFALEAEHARA